MATHHTPCPTEDASPQKEKMKQTYKKGRTERWRESLTIPFDVISDITIKSLPVKISFLVESRLSLVSIINSRSSD